MDHNLIGEYHFFFNLAFLVMFETSLARIYKRKMFDRERDFQLASNTEVCEDYLQHYSQKLVQLELESSIDLHYYTIVWQNIDNLYWRFYISMLPCIP